MCCALKLREVFGFCDQDQQRHARGYDTVLCAVCDAVSTFGPELGAVTGMCKTRGFVLLPKYCSCDQTKKFEGVGHIARIWESRDTYVVGSKSFRPDIQKPRQMENAVRDI